MGAMPREEHVPTNRRTFITGSLAATAASASAVAHAHGAGGAEAAQLRAADAHHLDRRAHAWAQEVAKLSNDQLTVRLFPAMQLGGRPPELYRQVRAGHLRHLLHAARLHLGRLPDDGADRTARHGRRAPTTAPGSCGPTSTSILARDFKDTKVLMLWNSDTAALMSQRQADPHAGGLQGHEDPHAVGGAVGAARGARRDPDRHAGRTRSTTTSTAA